MEVASDASICVKDDEYHPQQKSSRLQEMMLRVSASNDAAHLDEYLADHSACYHEDLWEAFKHLPLHIMIAKVVTEAGREPASPIIYTNAVLSFSDKRAIGRGRIHGSDLHVVYGNMCSPGGARLLERAIFSGKTFKKKFNLPSDNCKLLAVLPILTAQGDPRYAVSVESDWFADPTISASAFQAAREDGAEEHLQMIEDLLVVLPVLIRA